MNILKKKNGVALLSVMVLLLILTLLFPVMIKYANTSAKDAIGGTNAQKASYLARSNLEMALAAFQKTVYSDDENIQNYYAANLSQNGDSIKVQRVHLFVSNEKILDEDTGKSEYKSIYVTETENSGSTYNDLLSNSDYTYVGFSDVTIKYKNETHVYKTNKSNQKTIDVCCAAPEELPNILVGYTAGADIDKLAIQSSGDTFVYTKYHYNQYEFTALAEVGDRKVRRGATAIKTADTQDNTWINTESDAISSKRKDVSADIAGINQVSVNPKMATAKIPVSYPDEHVSNGGIVNEDALVFSSLGDLRVFSDAKTKINDMSNAEIKALFGNLEDGAITAIKSSPINLGTNPPLQYHERNKYASQAEFLNGVTYRTDDQELVENPEWKPSALNPNEERTKTNGGLILKSAATSARANNFAYFVAAGAIQVDLPIDVTVCPPRHGGAGRLGDADLDAQGSIYKALGFQSSDITFNDNITMSMSFTVPSGLANNATTGKRVGSVVLSAPRTTKYSYVKSDGTRVKAGKVFFDKDVYIIIYNRTDDGSPVFYDWTIQTKYLNYQKMVKDGYGISANARVRYTQAGTIDPKGVPSSTHYTYEGILPIIGHTGNHDQYTVYKLFNAGDVCLFNAEIYSDVNGEDTNVGISLVNWFVDAIYLPMVKEEYGENVFQNVSIWFQNTFNNAFFGAFNSGNFELDDIVRVGNTIDGTAFPSDEIDKNLYVVWDS